MFETSSVSRNRQKFHPLTFMVSAVLHLAAIGLITFFTVWDVETPERAPNQVVGLRVSPAPPLPPPAKIRKGNIDADREEKVEKKTEKQPDPEQVPIEIPPEVTDPDSAATEDGDETPKSDLPFGHPDGDVNGDPDGDPDGIPGGVGTDTGGGVVDDRTYTLREGVVAPVIIQRVEPVYPALLQRMGMSGVVRIECVISRSGQLTDIRVVHSTHQLFSESALDAVSQWTFQPGTLDGRPVATRFDFTVNFAVRR